METIIKDDPVLEKAHNRYQQFTQNDDLMEIYEARLKQKLTRDMDLQYERKQGQEQGQEQGVCWMYQAGVTIPVIVQRTGFEEAHVLAILRKNNLMD